MTAQRPLALVTGGSRGIGRAIVARLARGRYRVVTTSRGDAGELHRLQSELQVADCGPVEVISCDLSVPASVDALSKQLLDRPEVPSALVCNAGVSLDGLSTLTDLDEARRLFQVNFFSCVQLIKALGRPMARGGNGRIVLVGSIASELGTRGNAVYAASKGALQSYMRSVIEEFSSRGLTVNSVLPGYIETDMTAKYEAFRERASGRIPVQRFGRAEEVAAAVEFLLSPDAAYVNGASLRVDGGLSATVGLGA